MLIWLAASASECRSDFRNFSTLHKFFTKKPQFFYTQLFPKRLTNCLTCDIIYNVKRTEKQTDKQSDLSKQNFKKPLTSTTKCGIIKTVKEQIKIFYGAQHKKYLKKFLTNTAKRGIIKIVRKGKHFERN